MKRCLAGLLFVTACMVSNPPPQYPQGPQPPQGGPNASMQQPPQQPAQPPTGNGDVPIDPTADMPEGTLTTNATLALGAEAKVMLDARSDIFSATFAKADPDRGGMLPSALALAPGGTVVSFTKVVGKVGCSGDAAFIADGGDCAGGNTDILSTDKIAGIVAHDRTLFLVGLFTGPKLPAKAPERLDFSQDKLGNAFPQLKPQLGQVFFIGDGKTGTNAGVVQKFVIPAGATTLWLGYADAYGFQGNPGAYGDNKGGLAVSVVESKE